MAGIPNGLIRVGGEYPLTGGRGNVRLTGGRGNVRLTTDGSRSVTSSNVPDAFGVGSATANTASAFQWNGSAGYRTEGLAPLGLNVAYSFQKVGARYYDPALGCFLTRDTDLGQKPYTYCDGDPINSSDPSGYTPKTTTSTVTNPDGSVTTTTVTTTTTTAPAGGTTTTTPAGGTTTTPPAGGAVPSAGGATPPAGGTPAGKSSGGFWGPILGTASRWGPILGAIAQLLKDLGVR